MISINIYNMKILAVLLAWAGCLLPYLASPRQGLLLKPLSRPLAWTGFCLLQLLAFMSFRSGYGATTAFFMVLVVIMCAWPALVLASGHLRERPLLVCALGAALLSFIMGVG